MAGERILIVEDNELNAKLLRDVLDVRGFEVLESVTAEDGLVLAREHHPHLILMDIQLPGMDGMQALRELKRDERTAAIPVIAVTASVMPMERQEIIDAGFDGYQPKPLSVKLLLDDIERLLRAEGAG